MASAQDKLEALTYWVAGSILLVTLAVLGSPLWAIVQGVNAGFHITGTLGQATLHAVQPVPMLYYGFLVVFEIALIIRTVFVVWSRGGYESSF